MNPGVFVIVAKRDGRFVIPSRKGYSDDLRKAAFFVSADDAYRVYDPLGEIVRSLDEIVEFVWPE